MRRLKRRKILVRLAELPEVGELRKIMNIVLEDSY